MVKKVIFPFLIPLFLFFSVNEVYAGGFQLWEQDSSGVGDNHAGSGAEALNPGIEFYNPAGMTNLKHFSTSLGVAYIPLDIHYTGTVTAAPRAPNISARSHTNNYIPNFHAVYPIIPQFALGFGTTVPFGLMTKYPDMSALAKVATKTKLETVNYNPSFAIALTDSISIGAGFDALEGKAQYNSINPIASTSIKTKVKAKPLVLNNSLANWAYGYNAGLLLYLNPQTRFGLSYRSAIKVNGKGVSYDQASKLSSKNLTATIQLPPTWNMSFYSELNDRASVLFSAYYTEWEVFNKLVLNKVAILGQIMNLGMYENYTNTLAFTAGVHYWLMKHLMLKLGAGYDESPTQNRMRDVRLPDADRYSAAFGLRWELGSRFAVDIGWMHIFAKTANVNNTESTMPLSTYAKYISNLTTTVGTAHTNADVVGIELSYIPMT